MKNNKNTTGVHQISGFRRLATVYSRFRRATATGKSQKSKKKSKSNPNQLTQKTLSPQNLFFISDLHNFNLGFESLYLAFMKFNLIFFL
jgi:hypothetical protein